MPLDKAEAYAAERAITLLAGHIHETARSKGFYDKPINIGEKLMLINCELAEGLEWIRAQKADEPPKASDHIRNFSGWEEELADAVIRILDLARATQADISGAIMAKCTFNETRPHMHNKSL